jgi:hypothetical protein
VVAVFQVLGEPPAAVEPGNGALNDPTLGFDDKALGAISAFGLTISTTRLRIAVAAPSWKMGPA